MKTIKVYNQIQSTSVNDLLIEAKKLELQGWTIESEPFIDRSKHLNSKKYKMSVIVLSKHVFC